jgi:hypothetical protein
MSGSFVANFQPPSEAASYYRSLALICRQQAARYPDENWNWLSQAERFEHLAGLERLDGARACRGDASDGLPHLPEK